MARAAVRAKQAQQAREHAAANQSRKQRKHASGGNPNQDLFFTRLRRRQKWVFVVLAVLFAISFAALGVGSGSGGGLEQDFLNLFGSGSDPVGAAQAEITAHPGQAKGYQDLANAYVGASNVPGAIFALESYLRINKKDANVWAQLGGFEHNQGSAYAAQYRQVLDVQQLETPSSVIAPTGTLAGAFGTNLIDQYYSQQLSAISTPLYQKATAAFGRALTAAQQDAKYASPSNRANAWFSVYTAAQNVGNTKVELQALQQYVKLNPTTTGLKQLEATCKSLGGHCGPTQKKPAHTHKKK